ncbi:MAG: hypothetical protein Q9177_004876 [Variospora cf. flavescens]
MPITRSTSGPGAKVSENVRHTPHNLEWLLTVENLQCVALQLHKSTTDLARDLVDSAVTRDTTTYDEVRCLLGDLAILTVMLEWETTDVHDAELSTEKNANFEEKDSIKSEESSEGTVKGDEETRLP